MIEVVYALGNASVTLPSGSVATVLKGQHWPESDQVVKFLPELFTADPRCGLAYSETPPGHDADLNELPAEKPAKRSAKASTEDPQS